MKRILIFLLSNFLLINIAVSQNGISVNVTGAQVDNSAILDISSTSQGLLIPRMTTTQRNNIPSPATSLLIFNTTTNCFEAYVNSQWYSVSCAQCSGGGPPTSGCGGFTTITDSRDNQTYNITQIGSQCWMAQNLNYGTFEALPATGTQPAGYKYCYNNNTACPYGGLYEWANAMNSSATCNGDSLNPPCCSTIRGLCPDGWHIPSNFEWTLLEKNAGISPGSFHYNLIPIGYYIGVDEGGNLKEAGTNHWNYPNTAATNSTGFTALPGGFTLTGIFHDYSADGNWWTSTEYNSTKAWYRALFWSYSGIYVNVYDKLAGFSIRCLKN
jgi:uncharacterized protein (TIGR02145 family)